MTLTLKYRSQLTGLARWRIGIDDEVIAALTEPRYPCHDNTFETIVLTQTIYLCQLFLHLQEFDPCVIAANDAPDEELLRVFQDSLNREFNATYDGRVRDGPAPDGEALERVVRGLMLAQREENSQAGVEAAAMALVQVASPNDHNRPQLQQVLVNVLKELNEPVNKIPVRYEKTHGPRKDETWAARFATRIMQWRRMMRTAPGSLVRGVVEVDSQDVCGLDEEGLEVYRFVRNAAPGYIHLATPLQPELLHSQAQPVAYQIQPQHQPHHPHQHQRSVSSGMGPQHAFSSPIEKASASTPSVTSDTPRTTPQYSQQHQHQHQDQHQSHQSHQHLYQHREREQEHQDQPQGQYQGGASSAAESSMYRASQDMGLPPSKRPRSVQSWEGGKGPVAAGANLSSGAGQSTIRSGPMEVDTPQYDTMTASEETNALLRRVLSGISELGQKIDTMQTNLGQRITQLDGRLQGIQDRLHGIQDWIGIDDEEEQE